MLCLADRLFLSYPLWQRAQATGADLLWRVSKTFLLPCHQRFADGSYLSYLYRNAKDRLHQRRGIPVRVIEYGLPEVAGAEPLYRLVTTILDFQAAPASELAALYHQRWELETALDELKTHLRGSRIVLRSKSPDLVRQEFYGLLLTHFAIRGLMHEARPCRVAKIPTGSPIRTRFGWSVASCRSSVLFPPQHRKALHASDSGGDS